MFKVILTKKLHKKMPNYLELKKMAHSRKQYQSIYIIKYKD